MIFVPRGKTAQAYRLKNCNDPRNEDTFRGRSQQWILQCPLWSFIESQNLPSLPSDRVLSTGLRIRETRHTEHLMTGSTNSRFFRDQYDGMYHHSSDMLLKP